MSFNYAQTQNLTNFIWLIIGTNDDLICRDYKILHVIFAMKNKKAKKKKHWVVSAMSFKYAHWAIEWHFLSVELVCLLYENTKSNSLHLINYRNQWRFELQGLQYTWCKNGDKKLKKTPKHWVVSVMSFN